MNKMKFKPNNISPHTVYSIDITKKFQYQAKKIFNMLTAIKQKTTKK